MSYRIHAGVNSIEAPSRQPVLDRPAPDPELQQLPQTNHAVLSLSQGRQRPLATWVLSRLRIRPESAHV